MSKVHFRSRTVTISAGFCLLLCSCWLYFASPKSQASPPWLFGGSFTHWGFFGREDLSGPNAMSGTWFNFPDGTGGGGHGCRRDGFRCGRLLALDAQSGTGTSGRLRSLQQVLHPLSWD